MTIAEHALENTRVDSTMWKFWGTERTRYGLSLLYVGRYPIEDRVLKLHPGGKVHVL